MNPNERFARCVAFVCGPSIEGGYSNDPKDPGGPTNHGITQATLSHWRGVPASAADVKMLSSDEATAIYRALYWAPIGGDSLPAGLDLITFDCAVNQGAGTATRFLQQSVGIRADGHIGPGTIAAIARIDRASAIHAIANLRMAHYRSLPGWARYGNGWSARVDKATTLALVWAQ